MTIIYHGHDTDCTCWMLQHNDATFSAFSSLHTEDPYKQRQRR